MAEDVVERTLFRNDHMLLGEFRCLPSSERWQTINEVSPAPHVVFPRAGVVIRQVGREPVLADRNQALFYNPCQRFLRSLHDQGGDHCYFVELAPGAFTELVAGKAKSFPFASGPCDPDSFFLQHHVIAHLREPQPDPLLVEETLASAVERVCEQAFAFHHRRPTPRRPATRRFHRKAVEEAKALLADRLGERLTLGDVASAVSVSRYHLARVFRATTGYSMHGYRNQLRLRVALERLVDEDIPLAALASELGYVSNSHLTDSFRRTFGVAPSAVRGLSTVPRPRERRVSYQRV
jgi:AraC-like DNA-binding protein